MIATNMMIQEGATLFQTTGSSLIMITAENDNIKIDALAENVRKSMREKNSVRISDLVREFNESAENIIRAVKILKQKGFIEEI